MTDSKTATELRLMARLVREYDYAEISRMLRKAADELEQAIAATLGAHSKPQSKTGDALSDDGGSLSDATLGSGECELELNIDMTAIRCDKCGYELPAGTNLDTTRYCGGCGKAVKR